MKRKSGCFSWLLAVVVIVLFAFGMSWLSDRIERLRFPWAYASSGRPTLTGTWVGPLTSGSGQRLGLLVEMAMTPLDRGQRRARMIRTHKSPWLEGRVLVCAAPGRIQRFTLWGEPQDKKAGSLFTLSVSPADSVPLDGLSPSHIRGQWSGRDSLALALSLHMRKGQSAITSSDDPDTKGDTPATLKRGTEPEFNSLCNQLPRR